MRGKDSLHYLSVHLQKISFLLNSKKFFVRITLRIFRLDLFECLNQFNIYIRMRIERKKIFVTSFLLVKREKESLKIMVNIPFQSIKSYTIF